jgi:hypothetical protein
MPAPPPPAASDDDQHWKNRKGHDHKGKRSDRKHDDRHAKRGGRDDHDD